ncbi:Cleavage and polyadenylation specificity factor subunit 4 [Thoreauomyces humboldtii]|nr:Cleavage and polyadenylation specificity factor subunit 4 [Thoreauomyces humboldtii]
MLALHALPSGLTFDFEPFLVSDLKLDISRDRASSSSDVCKFYLKGYCHKGAACPQRHARNDRTVVCKHWLRGLCKKGDLCEFLHEYNLKKMPECWFYAKYGECSNPECMYMHVDPESKIKDCPWYLTGFCKLGLECRGKHARKPICQNYLTGFCPKGPDCTFGHPKFDPPKYNDASAGGGRNDQTATTSDNTNSDGSRRPFRSLDQVTCFKCSEKGHYANHCTKRRKFAQDEPSVGQPIPSVS